MTTVEDDAFRSAASPWKERLQSRLDSLGRYAEGRFVIRPESGVEFIPAERFLDPEFLKHVIARAAQAESPDSIFEPGRHSPSDAMRIHAHVSRFVRHYAGAISAPALVGLAEGMGIDVSASRCRLIMFSNVPYRLTLAQPEADVVTCNERPTPVTVDGTTVESLADLRSHVWRSLYAENLYPFITSIVESVKISPALLWTNVAEWVGVIADAAVQCLDERASEPFVADRDALLSAAYLPGIPDVPNLLHDREYWTPLDTNTYPYEIPTRRLCCLTYVLDDRFGRLCGSCPDLPHDDKVALARERDHAPAGETGGAAERRAIARGLQRPAMKRLLRANEQHRAAREEEGSTATDTP